MIRLVPGERGRAAYLVAEDERTLRKFLRRHGIRPEAAGFKYILPPPCIRLSCYRLAGDVALRILALGLPRITWGELTFLLLVVRRPNYGRLLA